MAPNEVVKVEIVRRRVEELMYARNPNSPNVFNLYSNENPRVRMTETEKKYYNE